MIIGTFTAAVFAVIAIDTHSLGLLLFGLILGGIFISAGIYFFRRPGIIEKRDRELDNPESKIYKKIKLNLIPKKQDFEKM